MMSPLQSLRSAGRLRSRGSLECRRKGRGRVGLARLGVEAEADHHDVCIKTSTVLLSEHGLGLDLQSITAFSSLWLLAAVVLEA